MSDRQSHGSVGAAEVFVEFQAVAQVKREAVASCRNEPEWGGSTRLRAPPAPRTPPGQKPSFADTSELH
jgi:hypothetical protein